MKGKIIMKKRKILKRIGLAVLGLGVISGVAVGVTHLVNYVKEDMETISPSFKVGTLDSNGEYLKDTSRLYTEKSFKCDGLQVKLDFDNEINYQFFFYDDLGNFMESTDIYDKGETITPLGSYARCVIIPTNDEDGKISLTERVKYPSQMTIRVSKKQDLKSFKLGNKTFVSIEDMSNLIFEKGGFSFVDGVLHYDFTEEWVCSSKQIIRVKKGNSFHVESTETNKPYYNYYKFKENDKGGLVFVGQVNSKDVGDYVVESGVDYILIDASIMDENGHYDLTDNDVKKISTSLIFKAN